MDIDIGSMDPPPEFVPPPPSAAMVQQAIANVVRFVLFAGTQFVSWTEGIERSGQY
jgi:hypothetical protein